MATAHQHRTRPLRRRLLALAGLILAASVYWVLGTEGGLRWVWSMAQAPLANVFTAEAVHGRLAGPLVLEQPRVRAGATRIAAERVEFDWHPGHLAFATLAIDRLAATGLKVALPSPTVEEPADEEPFGGFRFPLRVSVGEAEVDGAEITRGGDTFWQAESLRLADAVLSGDRARFDSLAAAGLWGELTFSGEVGTHPEAEVDLTVRWGSLRVPAIEPLLAGEGRLRGGLARLHVVASLDAPVTAQAEGSLAWLTQPFRWQAQATVGEFSLQQLRSDLRPVTLSGQLEGEGEGGDFTAAGRLDLFDPQFSAWRADLSGGKSGEHWQVEQLHLAADSGSEIWASGQWRQAGGLADIDQLLARVRWQALAWPRQQPAITSDQGQLDLEGALRAYHFKANAQVAAPELPPTRWTLAGRGNLSALQFSSVEGRGLDGRLTGQGSVAWRPELAWQADIALSGLDPKALLPQWPGRINARLITNGIREAEAQWRASASVKELSGTLRGQPVSGQLEASLDGQALQLRQLALRSGSVRLNAKGRVAEQWDFNWSLEGGNLADLAPQLGGSLSASGAISGPRKTPSVTARLSAKGAAFGRQRAASLKADADLDLAEGGSWRLEASLIQLRSGEGLLLQSASLSGAGTTEQHLWLLDAAHPEGELHLEGTGGMGDGLWSGRLHDGRLRSRVAGDWRQLRPALLEAGPTHQALAPWCWGSGQASLCLAGAGSREIGWMGSVDIEQFGLERLSSLWQQEAVDLRGALTSHLRLTYRGGVETLFMQASVVEGELTYGGAEGERLATPFSATVEVQGNSRGTTGESVVEVGQSGWARATLRLPGTDLSHAFVADQPLEGRLRLSLDEFGWLPLLVTDLAAPNGALAADLGLSGSVGDPGISGFATLRRASVELPRLGIALAEIGLSAHAEDGKRLRLEGSARSGPGSVQLNGQLTLESLEQWQAEFAVKGRNFQVAKLPSAEILASPDLNLGVKPRVVRLRGEILIPQAEITLPEFQPVVSASSDVVIVDRPEQIRAERWRTDTHLRIVFGEKVLFSGYGFSGRLDGALTIVEGIGGLARAQGELRIVDGEYSAYGQTLEIETGRLLYANTPLDNPGLDFRAVRRVDEVLAGVSVSGRLKNPTLNLFSRPPMDDTNVLSYLILGRPVEQATRSEGDELYAAALSLGLVGGGRIAEEIGTRFGIEEVALEAPGEAGEGPALVLGKYLSPRLYIQYVIGFLQTGDLVRVRYILGEHWVLEAESGEQSGADLLYTIER